jgi:hypothetical protein
MNYENNFDLEKLRLEAELEKLRLEALGTRCQCGREKRSNVAFCAVCCHRLPYELLHALCGVALDEDCLYDYESCVDYLNGKKLDCYACSASLAFGEDFCTPCFMRLPRELQEEVHKMGGRSSTNLDAARNYLETHPQPYGPVA